MNPLKHRKALPTPLRTLGHNETWLQEQIAKDPSILGLGDLHLIQRERRQPSGGRIDFLMSEPDEGTRYEIEVMLGAVDETHIIRAIEYWDVERQRYPTLDHRAVIVAEEITARFFNVIRLLNRAVPIVAIQLSAFQFEDNIVLLFTTVLDTCEFNAVPEEVELAEQADRAYWEKLTPPETLQLIDAMVSLVPRTRGEPRITFNRSHIALGTSGYNFCWFHPRRKSSICPVHIKVPAETRPGVIERLEAAGIAAEVYRGEIRFHPTKHDLADKRGALVELLTAAEEWSQR
jgi:hypothetical protein